MNWTVHFIISAVLLVATILVIVYCENKKLRRGKLLSSFKILLYGIAVAAFVLFMPYYYYSTTAAFKGLYAVLASFNSALKIFAFNGEFSFYMNNIPADSSLFNTVYLILTLVIVTVAPCFTVGFILSFFKDITAYANYYFRKNNVTYVFSELNEKSVALAADLRANHNNAVLIFTGVRDAETETAEELNAEAANIRAICFKKDILTVRLGLNKLKKETSFFIIGKHESENINQTLKLIDTYENRDKTKIYLFSNSIESELLLTSAVRGKVKVRRINEVQSLISRVLYDEGHVLFDNASTGDKGVKHISALIVGLGDHGSAMNKALTWYCQMDGYRISITAVDKDTHAESNFTAQCPALMSENNRGSRIGEAAYDITIHSGAAVESKEFADIIMSMSDITYVFVALGSDEDNVKAAVQVRMLSERIGAKPVIHAVMHSSEEKKALEGIHNFAGNDYDIRFIGDIRSSYSEKVIIDSDLEAAALKCHLSWNPDREEAFWKYEYNYRSSAASAIHMAARKHCKIMGADKAESELSKEEKEALGDLEHRRWNAYMRSEGYVYSGNPDRSTLNHLGKMHHNLVPTSQLNEEDKYKDVRVGSGR